MAIVKARVSRLDGDVSPDMISADESDDEEEAEEVVSMDDESDPSDTDSGMGSDEFDLSELGEANTEFCQVGSQSFSVPIELYDLPDLGSVLSLEIWNECLSEEERFRLSEFLPDMDQETLARTLSELFAGKNFHFGSPVHELFKNLKGGMLDPRVVLYRRGLSFFKKREHYHSLRKYQNSMVGGLVKIGDAWRNCLGYGIEERLRLLNILRNQKSLVGERNGDIDSETDSDDSREALLDKRVKMDRQALEPRRLGKDSNAKGILKVTHPKFTARTENVGVSDRFPLSGKHGFQKNAKTSKGLLGFPQQERFESGYGRKAWNQKRTSYDKDEEGEEEEDDVFKEQYHALEARASLSKSGKKNQMLKQNAKGLGSRVGDVEFKDRAGMSQHSSKSRITDQGVTIAAYNPHSLETMSNAKYPAKDWMHPHKDRLQNKVQRGNQVDWSTGDQPCQHDKSPGGVLTLGSQVKAEEWNAKSKSKIWKSEDNFKCGKSRTGLDLTVRSYKTSPAQIRDTYAKNSEGEFKGKPAYNGGIGMEYPRGDRMFTQSEETESDSSEKPGEDGEMSTYLKKDYSLAAAQVHRLGGTKAKYDSKMGSKSMKVGKKVHTSILPPEMEPYSAKGKHKSRTVDPNYVENIVLAKKTHASNPSAKMQQSWQKSYGADKKRKGASDLDHSLEPAYMHDDNDILDDNVAYLNGRSQYVDGQKQTNLSDSRYQGTGSLTSQVNYHGRSNMSLLGCNSVPKKGKGNTEVAKQYETEEFIYPQSSLMQQIDEPNFIKKKGKRKADAITAPSVVTPNMMTPENETADVEPEPKHQKKLFTPITPSKHTDFSFSIIHLLSAIRKVMITPLVEDAAAIGSRLENGDVTLKPKGEGNEVLQASNGTDLFEPRENVDMNALEPGRQNNLPSLTIHEIVDRVRTDPGDPCILETEEPLQDLVRGVLKIFSSKTAPLGAKGWKAVVSYEKSNKSWSWVGPVSFSSSNIDTVEEETSPEAWGLPHKTLVKLVDSFANWLKSGQETLKQIGSLPPPPASMLAPLDEKERFRDLRAQKSLNTISPSTEEIREFFRKEELLRYSIPDRAFSYTAADGKKSIVAPLRRGGGKPTSKARDHFMLKPDRPPHVTILCLVRDAAARLPGSIGTRADVCTLIRDSQYIVEDVSDEKVNQVVSGALDRLHYERDPCVQFDGDRKLWVYLHIDREEEDFEDDGTSSTKKWKRPRKDATDQSETGANDANFPVTGDPAGGASNGYAVNPDLNVDRSSFQAGNKNMPIYYDLKSNMQNIQSYIDPSSGCEGQANTIRWQPLGLNSLCENKMRCQENSTKEDFDDENFVRERPVGFMSATLL